MPLKGIKVVEFVGLAPGPFCGKILADFGALVTRIDKSPVNQIDIFKEGKRTIALNLKQKKAQEIAQKICVASDVVIEPFRPGVMERLGLGPKVLLNRNERLIYAKLTGFGQHGSLAQRAGHDINYVALSGLLSMLGRKTENPIAPVNFMADMAGGSLMCAFGILMALFEREKSGKGQIIDAAMVDGTAYIGSWLMKASELPMKMCSSETRGENILDSGYHFYDTYETKDGKFMSVGAIEPQFYEELIKIFEITENLDQYSDNEALRKIFTKKFLEKTQNEWTEIFDKTDACVFPVLSPEEARSHPHNKARNAFVGEENSTVIVNPAPKLSRTPGVLAKNRENVKNCLVTQTLEILKEVGIEKNDVNELLKDDVVRLEAGSKL